MMNPRKRNASAVSSSVSQARLDRIANPTGTYLRAYVRWLNRLTDVETWPSQMLKERQIEMQPELAELEKLCRTPSESLTGPEWWKLAERLDKLRAQERALEEVLERRMWAEKNRRAGDTLKPMLSRATRTQAQELEISDDPFRDE
jgi:hypothetical protein